MKSNRVVLLILAISLSANVLLFFVYRKKYEFERKALEEKVFLEKELAKRDSLLLEYDKQKDLIQKLLRNDKRILEDRDKLFKTLKEALNQPPPRNGIELENKIQEFLNKVK